MAAELMEPSIQLIVTTAAGLAILHTAVGIDHTVPFVLLARAEKWSLGKLWVVTGLCGLGHVLASVVIGFVVALAGLGLDRFELLEESRGRLATWILVGFGLAYAAWGYFRSRRRRRHAHQHVHLDGTEHDHDHHHAEAHIHVHGSSQGRHFGALALFVVLVFGPCETLIPLMLVPAVSRDWFGVAAVVGVFGALTVATMLALVTVGFAGLRWRGIERLERHLDVVAGLCVAATGVAVGWLGI